MTENIVWLIDLLFTHETGKLASLINQGKLKAYDRYDTFGDADAEQREQALDALARHVERSQGQGLDDYLVALETARGYPDSLLTTSGFLAADLEKAKNLSPGQYLRAEILALEGTEKRKRLLELFRELGGKRPGEGGAKQRGALAKLQRATGIDDKNLGELLDKAIVEERQGRGMAQVVRTIAAK